MNPKLKTQKLRTILEEKAKELDANAVMDIEEASVGYSGGFPLPPFFLGVSSVTLQATAITIKN